MINLNKTYILVLHYTIMAESLEIRSATPEEIKEIEEYQLTVWLGENSNKIFMKAPKDYRYAVAVLENVNGERKRQVHIFKYAKSYKGIFGLREYEGAIDFAHKCSSLGKTNAFHIKSIEGIYM